jgi:hypothetical protein
LLVLSDLEILSEGVLAGFEPRHAPRPRDVQQDAPADQPRLEHLDGVDLGPIIGDGTGRSVVVHQALVGDVAQRIDVTVAVVAVVGTNIILQKVH